MVWTQRKLKINGYSFEYVEVGEGTPVLFVHGSVSDYRTWLPQLEAFGRNRHAIAYSRRYHWPNAPIGEDVDYAMAQHVADLDAAVEALAPSPVHLVGHSYGAFLSLLLAIRQPALMRSLVLAEPPVVPLFVSNPPLPKEILRLLATRPRTAAAVLRFGARGLAPAAKAFRAGNQELGLRIFGNAVLGTESFRKMPSARMQQVKDNLITAEFLGSGFAHISADEIRCIDRPVLLVTGNRSPVLFHHLIDRLKEILPDARCATIDGASHIMHEDNAAEFNREVLAFLAEVDVMMPESRALSWDLR